LLALGYVETVATTPVRDEAQLREHLTRMRDLVARHTNPAYRR
jgi:hypothetical protein